jgi:SAM-dependent methyltransferase
MTAGGDFKSFIVTRPWLTPFFKTINDLRCKTWDLLHSTDTCGQIPLASLDFQSENKALGFEYHSVHPRITLSALATLGIKYENYTFIDFGCGKGRVLLLASEFPFRRVVGVEFAPSLAETARRNLERYRSQSQRCKRTEVICTDATKFRMPLEPEVLYFYSPFKGAVMDRVVQNIESSVESYPRDVLVLFAGLSSMRDRAFGGRCKFERVRREKYFDVYQYGQRLFKASQLVVDA